jgi:diacylglycerol kinase family enzyme
VRIAFLSNPRSGRGVSRWARQAFPASLRAAGHDVAGVAVGEPADRLTSALAGADGLVIAGGDGTVHRAAPHVIRSGVPIYHVPCGNENLFARQFGMDRQPATLLSALEGRKTIPIDAAAVEDGLSRGGPPEAVISLLMCSIGPDAGVIRRLTELRTRAIGHLAYVEPLLREWISPTFPRITVDVDGRRVIQDVSGALIIANSRQYAFRIDPAVRADMSDGLLDVVFLPGRTRLSMLGWAFRCRFRREVEASGGLYLTGRQIRVTTDAPAPYQIDGDSPGWQGAGIGGSSEPGGPVSLSIRVLPGVLNVLLPSKPPSP